MAREPQNKSLAIDRPRVDGGTQPRESIDQKTVDEFAAEIRGLRKTEPYKGKGIRYQGEYIKRKQGKALAGGSA